MMYLFDVLEAFNDAALDTIAGGAPANTIRAYKGAVLTALKPIGGLRVNEVTAAAVDEAFIRYQQAVGPSRYQQARSGWKALRKWALANHRVGLPPGAILTEKGRKGRHDPPVRGQHMDVAQADREELIVMLRHAGGFPLRDLIALRWEQITVLRGPDNTPQEIEVPRGAGTTAAFGEATFIRCLLGRQVRLGSPTHGPVFPRVPGSDEPLSLADADALLA